MNKILLSIGMFLILAAAGNGQTMKAYLEAAEQALEQGNHYAALVYFDEALEFDTNRVDLLYKSAEAARSFNAYKIAAERYKKVIEKEKNAEYPLASFWRAVMLQRLGEYEEASMAFSMYLSEYGGDDEYYSARATKEKEAVEWAIEGAPSPYREVNLEHLDGSVNTPYSEFGALATEEIMYFSSLRYTKEDDDRYPKRTVSKILKKEKDDPEGTPIEGGLNETNLHTAHTSFSMDGTRMYYTLCDYKTDDSILCKIYLRRIDEDGILGEAIALPDYINVEGFTATQPNIGYDPFLNKEVLFYVSDKDGGRGKNDIYYSVIDGSGNFAQPINLESVNTPEDDISPFYHKKTKTLFFSSEGYFGYGGFDVFCVKQTDAGWGKVENISTPINSSFHDVYFTLSDDQKTGYFSSNRLGSMYLDEEQEACCFDVYKANIKPCDLTLKTLVFDALNNELLLSTKTVLKNLTDDEATRLSDSLTGGQFLKELDCNKEYRIVVEKEGYYPDSIAFSTIDIEDLDTILKKIYLYPSHLDLDVLTFNKRTLKELKGATVRVVDLLDRSVPDLVLTNPDSNTFAFKVERGKQYRIIASKENFTTASIDFETPEDRGNNERIVKKLYLEPAGFLKYLPLYIYYDNDQPNPKSWTSTTDQLYTQTFDPYYAKKDTFKQIYSEGLEGEAKTVAENSIDEFFDNKLKKGYDEYLLMLELLHTLLDQGMNFEIVVRGFASPRASSAYNKRLGERRFDAVRNEIEGYQEGVLIPFIKNGALKIRYVSYGEQQAPKTVSDDLNDERNSIYSPDASKERRVEVIEVKKISN